MPHVFPKIRSVFLFVLVCGVVALVGCSRPTGTISGKVTYKGEPVKIGNISFVSTEGQTTVSAILAEDGTYTIPTISVGSCKVCVDTSSFNPKTTSSAKGSYGAKGGKDGKEGKSDKVEPKPLDPSTSKIPEGYHPSNPMDTPASKNKARYTAIPEKYAKPESTDLTYTVVAGSQTFDIELK
jgi:hypothetical protein